MIEYEVSTITYSSNTKVVSDCNEIIFQNWGRNIVYINTSIVLLPVTYAIDNAQNEVAQFHQFEYRFRGNLFEIDVTQYSISFGPDVKDFLGGTNKVPTVGTGNNLLVIRKSYKYPDKVRRFMLMLQNPNNGSHK